MSEARWLDDEQLRAWKKLIAVVELLPGTLETQLQRDSSLSHFEYFTLAMLSEAPDRTLRMSQLAEQTTSSASRLSHAVARLEEKGWVRRDKHPTDRRGSLAVLTDDGWQAVVAAAPGHVAAVRQVLFDRLAPGQATQLRAITDRLTDQR